MTRRPRFPLFAATLVVAVVLLAPPARADHDLNGCSIPGWLAPHVDPLCNLGLPSLCSFVNQDVCNGHDNCYQHELNCGQKTKDTCDLELRNTVKDFCRANYGGASRSICLATAEEVYLGVKVGGLGPALAGMRDATGDEAFALQHSSLCPNGVQFPGTSGEVELDYTPPNEAWWIDDIFVGFGTPGQILVQDIVEKYSPNVIEDTPEGIVTVEICWGDIVQIKGEWVCME